MPLRFPFKALPDGLIFLFIYFFSLSFFLFFFPPLLSLELYASVAEHIHHPRSKDKRTSESR